MCAARISATTQSQKFGPILIPNPIILSCIDTLSQIFEEVTITIRRQRDKGSRAGNDNFCPMWSLERSSDLSTFFKHKKYLISVHLKLTTCCSKNYPVVLSLSTHNQKFEYNRNPSPRKFQMKVYPNHRNFPVKVYPIPRIFRPQPKAGAHPRLTP